MTGEPPSLVGGCQATRAESLKISLTIGASGASGTTVKQESVSCSFVFEII